MFLMQNCGSSKKLFVTTHQTMAKNQEHSRALIQWDKQIEYGENMWKLYYTIVE